MEISKYKIALIVGAGEGLSASLARLFAREGIKVALAARKIEKLGALCTETGARALPAMPPRPKRSNAVRHGRARDRHAGYRRLQRQRTDARRLHRSRSGGGRKRDRRFGLRRLSGGAAGGHAHAAEKRGAILFTGASASVKGYAQSAPFAMGKFALRGLAQSMARELSPQGIHVAHFVIDGGIRSAARAEPPTGRTPCSIPTRLRRATGTSCSSRAAPGPGRSNCGRGWRSFDDDRRRRVFKGECAVPTIARRAQRRMVRMLRFAHLRTR